MTTLTFFGKIAQSVYQDITFNGPPDTFALTNFYNTIQWEGNVPAFLQGANIQTLITDPGPIRTITYTPYVQFTTPSSTTIQFELTVGTYDSLSNFITMPQPSIANHYFPNIPLSIISEQSPIPVLTTTLTSIGINFNVTFFLQIRVDILCSGINLESAACLNYCNQTSNLESCKSAYSEYCFTPTINNNIIFQISPACQTFTKNLYSSIGADAGFDSKMEDFCRVKYGSDTFEQFFQIPPVDLDICACHMPDSFYIDYIKDIESQIPNLEQYLSLSGINNKCLLQACADSSYRPTPIPKTGCPLPKCLNIASFTNNGEIGKVTITQDCKDIIEGKEGIGSWIDKNWVWFVLGILLLLFLIIIIVIILETRKKKSKNF